MLPNSIEDFNGYMHFIDMNRDLWEADKLLSWGVTKDVNPYTLPDDHPAAILRMTTQAVVRFITGENARKKSAGFYLQKVWAKCLIRRTYASEDPLLPGTTIGAALPKLHTRRIVCRFTEAEHLEYLKFSILPRRKLAHVLENGRLVWNRKYSRQLVLNSTWTGFHYIGDDIMADTVRDWKTSPKLLYCWIKLLHKKQVEVHGHELFRLPDYNDIPAQLAVVCQGAPKLRHTLRIIAELVVLMKRKIIIWCSLPPNQLLLFACFQALRIDAACYTADLNRAERSGIVNKFITSPSSCFAFIGGFNVGSCGLNLHLLCNWAIDFDCAANRGQEEQAIGRLRRIGQKFTVERFELSVESSFQDRQSMNLLMKALPGAIAELAMNVYEYDQLDEDGEKEFSVGDWYLIGGELVQGPDPRVTGIHAEQKLTPLELVEAIFTNKKGSREEQWVTERVDYGFDVDEELGQDEDDQMLDYD